MKYLVILFFALSCKTPSKLKVVEAPEIFDEECYRDLSNINEGSFVAHRSSDLSKIQFNISNTSDHKLKLQKLFDFAINEKIALCGSSIENTSTKREIVSLGLRYPKEKRKEFQDKIFFKYLYLGSKGTLRYSVSNQEDQNRDVHFLFFGGDSSSSEYYQLDTALKLYLDGLTTDEFQKLKRKSVVIYE